MISDLMKNIRKNIKENITQNILGVIFCGGKASRLGGMSKMDLSLGGKSLLEYAAMYLCKHEDIKSTALSVKPDTILPSAHAFDIIHDLQDQSVAIALLSALKYAKAGGYDAILTLPVDTPFLPENFADKMIKSSKGMDCVYAKHGSQLHGLHSLWKTSCYDELHGRIMGDKIYRISALYDKPLSTSCLFTDVDKSMFLNINTPENLKRAQSIASRS